MKSRDFFSKILQFAQGVRPRKFASTLQKLVAKNQNFGGFSQIPFKTEPLNIFLTGSFGGFFYATHPILYVILPCQLRNFKMILQAWTGVRFRQKTGQHNKRNAIYVQGEPLLAINGFINPIEWPYING